MSASHEPTVTVVRIPSAGVPYPRREIMTRIGSRDLDLAAELHVDDGTPRPYAVAYSPRSIDIVCFDGRIARALLASGDGARLVTHKTVTDILPEPGRHLAQTMRLAFLTPTAFRAGGRAVLLPEPGRLFADLLESWRSLGWPELPEPETRRLGVDPEVLAVRRVVGGKESRHGFVGIVRYDLSRLRPQGRQHPQFDQACRTLWQLARFGEWRGVGAWTTDGMGRIRVLPRSAGDDEIERETWRPEDAPLHVWSE